MTGVKFGFTSDTVQVLRTAAALVNTAGSSGDGDDRLSSLADLDAFVATWRWTGSRAHDAAELASVRELRASFRSWWTLDEHGLVEALNDTLARERALPQLVDHDGWGWHLHACESSAPLATRMAVDTAMAFVDLVRAGQLDRLGSCAAPGCDDVVVDLSKNRSKRYCEGSCGNRMAVAAYRMRQRAVKT